MGMRKKWSRLITIHGVRYRYHVAEDRHERLTLSICIQQVQPAGQRLISGFPKPTTWTEVAPGHHSGQVTPHAVTPRVIRQLILEALKRGWQPAESGLGPFHLPGWQAVEKLPDPVKSEKQTHLRGHRENRRM
jgi:hypothetical protein